MTRVTLIRPPIVIPSGNQTAIYSPPIGLAYVAAVLREAGHDVQVIDALGEALDESHPSGNDCVLIGMHPDAITARIRENTEVIGISAGFSFEWPVCRDLAGLVRRRFPDAVLVAGGEHVTAAPEDSLTKSAVDIAVLGEGEETMRAIADAVAAGALDASKIDGVAWKTADGSVQRTLRRARIRAIDELPWPAWDLMPIGNYLDRGYGFGVSRGRSMPMLASRGCPYQCTFCSSPRMWTTRWGARDPRLLLDEMAHYQERYGVTNFDFYDLTAIVKKAWIVEFCTMIEERGMRFTWQLPSGTRSEAIDDEVAALLYKSGCRNLSYAPESGSPGVLARIKKKVKIDRMLESIRSSRAAGLNLKANIMLGFPGETWREVGETFRFIAQMAIAGVHDLSIWGFSPYPGTELYDQIAGSRTVTLDDDFYDSLRSYTDASRTVSYSEHITDSQLKTLRFLGQAMFYLIAWTVRPWRPFGMVWRVVNGRQESRAEMALINMLRKRRLFSTVGR